MISVRIVLRLAGFRKLRWYETMESVKKKSEFWFQSKLFRESVEIFGSYGIDSMVTFLNFQKQVRFSE